MNKLLHTTAFGALTLTSMYAYAQQDNRPNIIVILADDLGYSDMGCYGGEIQTPNLDKLAQEGIRFNSFYNASRSCPTRASLLTGLYPHQAGIGRMTFNDNLPGYRGQLTENGVTIAEVLKEAGYQTGLTSVNGLLIMCTMKILPIRHVTRLIVDSMIFMGLFMALQIILIHSV